jgi:phage tail protein X
MAYTVKQGDNLSTLAKKNNTTVSAIVAANPGITDPNKIYTGQSITIPTASTVVTPVKTATIQTTAPKTSTTISTPKTSTTSTANTQTSASNTPTFDSTIQNYRNQYSTAQAAGDTLGMLRAAEAADAYRTSTGQQTTNTQAIANLKSKLSDDELAEYYTGKQTGLSDQILNFNQTYQPETTKEEYMSEITNYINSLLQEQANTAAANTAKSRNTLLSDADISKQELDDIYAQQLSELAAQADKIRAAYTSGKANIETTRAKTLPTYDTAMNQQDILAQRQAKQIGEEFAQRGLSAGGQVVSELGQNAQANLSEIGKISTSKQNYIADVANDLANLETEQATGLSDVERAKSTAAQTLSSGKSAIIKKVNAALSNLTIYEQALLDNLAEQRTQMLYDASKEYNNLSKQEKDDAFNMLLQQAGVAADSVDAIRSLIDDKNEANMAALEYKIKELEYQNLSKESELERQSLEQDIKNKKLDYATGLWQLENLKKGLNRDGSTPKTTEEKYNYKTDQDWIEDYTYAQSTTGAKSEIISKSKELIAKYGVDGYNALLAKALE